jgi:hypothetical protein
MTMKKKSEKVTLKDLDVRCANILRDFPDIPRCSFAGCDKPVDGTEGMGWDTSCPYHRLLFDWWLYNVIEGDMVILKSERLRRSMFAKWVQATGEKDCNKIVLKMAKDPINWSC